MAVDHARRGALVTLASALAVGVAPAGAQTQAFPTKPITLIVPFAAGSATDTGARLFARAMEQELGQPVIVDNKAGGSGTVAADYVARAPADGYTLMFLGGGSLTQTFFSRKLNTDIVRDLAPVIQISRGSLFLFVRSDLPVNNVRDFIELVRKEPGKYNYASIAASQMMTMEVLKDRAKLQIAHIPYKSLGQVFQAIEAKDVVAYVGGVSGSEAMLQSGKVRLIVVFGDERNLIYPDVPTAAESGLPGVEAPYSQGIWAPAKTPAPVIARLNSALNAVLKHPQIVEFVRVSGATLTGGPPQRQLESVKFEHEYWARAAKVSNFTPE